MSAFLSPVYPVKQRHLSWGQLYGCSQDLLIAKTASEYKGLILLVVADMQSAYQAEQNVRYFAKNKVVQVFPDWETLPYDVFSPHEDIVSERLKTLYELSHGKELVLIISAATLMQCLAPRQFIESNSLIVKVGDSLDIELLREQLQESGYRNVSQVIEHGEFATRGSLIDMFPMGSNVPYRIDLFDDEVDSIRSFLPETQLTIEKHESIELLPAKEFPLDDAGIKTFRKNYRAEIEGDPQNSLVYRSVSDGNPLAGIEYYLPLFFNDSASIFDYLPEKTLVFWGEGCDGSLDVQWAKIADRYEERRHDVERPILSPERLYLSPDQLREKIENTRTIHLHRYEQSQEDSVNYAVKTLPAMMLQARSEQPLLLLKQFMALHKDRILFVAESPGRREHLLGLLKDNQINPVVVEDWQAFLRSKKTLAITVAPMNEGLWLEDESLAIVPESLILGQQVQQQRRRRKPTRDADSIIRNLTDLNEGAPVVHEEHGVGRYLGMQTLTTGNIESEYITLEYAKGDKLYVPVASLHLISRYTGASSESAPLHRLGTEQWNKIRKKAADKAHDIAAELLEVYAKRAAQKGHSFPFDEGDYQLFAEAFPFEETPDQLQAIDAVKQDMLRAQPMDRVVCGDVGFGKTEVAMRAAFIAANTGKQVAMVAPTTLLVNQHTQNFKDRFADWPFQIESLSRFKTPKETKEALRKLESGEIDIVVGTHKLLQSDIKFKDLGLVIIDEEHRFGVRHKEQLKKLRANVDLLTMTATPIPRTLNMSLSGLRDLSIIATPPVQRHRIKTFVNEWDKGLIQEACARELSRGGQIYFLHNEVKTIQKITEELSDIVPEATVRFAHGQMPERELEGIMQDFYHQRFNILVATTIIESGIDVPTANTIIINRADKLGLAQLHQIRGRVGRSHHRAYAYLITPPRKVMTADAVKRLEAIESLEDLGVGFTLASHDMEIRGAGELLGEGQSGQIQEIGFTMYNELLERAVNALKSGNIPELNKAPVVRAVVDIGATALIPDSYLPDVHERLILYKRIASAETKEALKDLRIEMIDRFGLLPDQVNNLFDVTDLKLIAEKVGVTKLDIYDKGGRIIFNEKPNVDPMKIIELIQKRPWVFKLDGQDKLKFEKAFEDVEERVSWVKQLLLDLEVSE